MTTSRTIPAIATALLATFLVLTFFAGCTQTREAEHAIGIGGGVPKGANKLAAGKGSQGITTTAPKAGKVYVNDESTAEVVYDGKINQGDQIIVDGASGTVTAGQFKKDVKIKPDDTYAVYVD